MHEPVSEVRNVLSYVWWTATIIIQSGTHKAHVGVPAWNVVAMNKNNSAVYKESTRLPSL